MPGFWAGNRGGITPWVSSEDPRRMQNHEHGSPELSSAVNVKSKRESGCIQDRMLPKPQAASHLLLLGTFSVTTGLGRSHGALAGQTAQKSHCQAFPVPMPNSCALVPTFCQEEAIPFREGPHSSPEGLVPASCCSSLPSSPQVPFMRKAQDSDFTTRISSRALQSHSLSVPLVLWQWGKSWRSP